MIARGMTFVAVAWFALAVVGAAMAVLPFSWACRVAAPDVLFVLILYVGLQAREGVATACAFAVVLGWLGDLFGGAPKGLHMLAFLVAMLAARAASTRLLVRGGLATAVVCLGFAVPYGLVVAGLRASFEPEVGWATVRQVPVAAIASTLFAPLLFRLYARIDARFLRDPRALLVAR